MLNIISGKRPRAVKLVITGSEGIGKSTLASKAPGVLFVDTEGGTDQLDVRRISGIDSWDKLMAVPKEILSSPGCCETLVIDTADWAEAMCIGAICSRHRVNGIEAFGYGKGYTYLYEEFNSFLNELNKLIAAGKNVIVIAHAKMKKQELPDEQGAFDRWEMKLSKQVAPLLKEWGDAVLFCNYKIFVTTTEAGSKKASGGQRVIYTTHHPCWDAKNRFGLKEELPLDFSSISEIFPQKSEEPKSVGAELKQLMDLLFKDDVEESELQAIVARKGVYGLEVPVDQYSAQFISSWIIPNWERIRDLIEKNRSKAEANQE
ncbi:MAG: ATP-binding protein [Spirochaetales bacterium]|nr:ATP-binding protein [Spirochaetales bacterium]